MNRVDVATGPSMTVGTISEFADRLRASADADAVVIDVAELADVDLSFVQLIDIARREAAAGKRSLALAAPAPASLAALLDRCGYTASATPDDRLFWFHGDKIQ